MTRKWVQRRCFPSFLDFLWFLDFSPSKIYLDAWVPLLQYGWNCRFILVLCQISWSVLVKKKLRGVVSGLDDIGWNFPENFSIYALYSTTYNLFLSLRFKHSSTLWTPLNKCSLLIAKYVLFRTKPKHMIFMKQFSNIYR